MNVTNKSELSRKIGAALMRIKFQRPDWSPGIGIVLDKELANAALSLNANEIVPYNSIPNFPADEFQGLKGELRLGNTKGKEIAVMVGRPHFYEGWSLGEIVFPVRVLCAMGIKTLIITSVARAANGNFKPGDFVLVSDHINMLGDSPCRGRNDPEMGPRFFSMTPAYDPGLLEHATNVMRTHNFVHQHGVYAYMPGPQFETQAEARAVRTLGADVVGMSMVPEVITARHMGVRILGISIVTGHAAPESPRTPPSGNVEETLRQASVNFSVFLREMIENLPPSTPPAK